MNFEKDVNIVMKLIHYFVTNENYTPVVLKGANNEIWLENLSGEYKIIRIVSNYIYNDEQLKTDLFRTSRIVKNIKKKTITMNVKVLSIFTNISDYVTLNSDLDIDLANVVNIIDLNKYKFIKNKFPTIIEKTTFNEEGAELLSKITKEIGSKNISESKKIEDVFSPKVPYVTYAILFVTIFIYIIDLISGSELINRGFLSLDLVRYGQWYRVITAIFFHADITHIGFNMYALHIIGKQVEGFYGHYKFLVIYLLSGILGNLFTLILLPNAASVGASGSIFGILGALLYFGYNYRVYLGNVIKTQILPIIFINLMIGFMVPQINNIAHIGGLLSGILVSAGLGLKYKDDPFIKNNAIIILLITTLFLTYLINLSL